MSRHPDDLCSPSSQSPTSDSRNDGYQHTNPILITHSLGFKDAMITPIPPSADIEKKINEAGLFDPTEHKDIAGKPMKSSRNVNRNMRPCIECSKKKTRCKVISQTPPLCEKCKEAQRPTCEYGDSTQLLRSDGTFVAESSGPNQHTPLRSGGESKSPDLLPSPTPTFGATTYERPSEDLRMRPSPSLDSRDNLPPYDDVQVSPVYPVQSDIRLYEGRDPRNNRLMTPPDRKIPSTSILHEHSVERQFLELQSRGRGHPSHLPGPGARTTGYQLHYTSPPNPGPVQAALTTAGVDVGRAFYSGVNSNFGNGSSTYPNNVSVPAVNTTEFPLSTLPTQEDRLRYPLIGDDHMDAYIYENPSILDNNAGPSTFPSKKREFGNSSPTPPAYTSGSSSTHYYP